MFYRFLYILFIVFCFHNLFGQEQSDTTQTTNTRTKSDTVQIKKEELSIEEKFFLAVKSSDITKTTSFLNKGISLDIRDKKGNSPVFYAIKNFQKFPEYLEFLFKKGFRPHLINYERESPFFVAVKSIKNMNSLREVFDLLLENHANIYHQDGKGNTILMYALLQRKKGLVEVLLEYESFSKLFTIGNYYNQIPFLALLDNKDKKLYEKVLAKIEDFSNDEENQLLAAIELGKMSDVLKLLTKDVNISFQYRAGKTPLIFAIEQYEKDPALFNFLIKSKKLDVNQADINGYTPLMHTLYLVKQKQNIYDVLNKLLRKGASIYEQDYRGNSLMMHIITKKKFGFLEWLGKIDKKRLLAFLPNYKGQTPLMIAASSGYNKFYRYLLGKRSKFKRKDEKNRTLLMYALRGNNQKIITSVLNKKVKIDEQDIFGRTALMYAIIWKRSRDIISQLLKRRPNINLQDEDGKTAFMYCLEKKLPYDIYFMLCSATKKFDYSDKKGRSLLAYALRYSFQEEMITNILNKKVSLKKKDIYNRGLFLMALLNKKPLFIKFYNKLIRLRDNKDKNQNGLLFYALMNQKASAVVFLLNKLLNVSFLTAKNQTFLMLATQRTRERNQYLQYFKYFLREKNLQDEKGRTALMYAVMQNNNDVLKVLLDSSADANLQDNKGRTVLMYLIARKNYKGIKILLDYKCDVNLADNDGVTPLMYALRSGDQRLVNLFGRRATKWDTTTIKGERAVHYAIMGRNNNLIKKAFRLTKNSLDKVDTKGKTLLMYACEFGSFYFVKKLLKSKVDINAQDKDGKTALMYACEFGFVKIANELIKQKEINLSLKDKSKKTHLMYSAMKMRSWLFSKHEADIDLSAVDINGNDALLHASKNSNQFMVQYLVDLKVKVDRENSLGESPLTYVLKEKSIKMLRTLFEIDLLKESKVFDGSGKEVFWRNFFVMNSTDKEGKSSLMYLAGFYSYFQQEVFTKETLEEMGEIKKEEQELPWYSFAYPKKYKEEEEEEEEDNWDVFIKPKDKFAEKLQRDFAKNQFWNDKKIIYDLKKFSSNFMLSYLYKFLEFTLNIDRQDKRGKTALMYHSQKALKKDYIEAFEKHKANFSLIDNQGKNALHYACRDNFSLEVVQYLSKKIDVRKRDNSGRNALEYALSFNPNPKIALWLLKKLKKTTLKKNKKKILKLLKENPYFSYYPQYSYRIKDILGRE